VQLHSELVLVKGIKEWLWIFANTDFGLFHAADTRSRAELDAILGSSYEGVLSSDDYSAYNGYPVKAQQKCLAHLRRHFKKLIKLPGLNNQEIGSSLSVWSMKPLKTTLYSNKTKIVMNS
jgi:transposase